MYQLADRRKKSSKSRVIEASTTGTLVAILAGFAWNPATVLAQLPTANLVQDSGFEPVTVLHAFQRNPGDPWIPGEWNAENASVVGESPPISPHAGTGMLRMDATAGTASQVNQIIDVSTYASDIDAGQAVAHFSIWTNAPAASVSPNLLIRAGESRNPSVGTLVPVGGSFIEGYNMSTQTTSLDSDPATWEQIDGVIALPSGTRFLEFQMLEANASIPPDGVYFDTASAVLEPHCTNPPSYMVAWYTGDDCFPADFLGNHDGTFTGFPFCPVEWKVGGGALTFFAGTYVVVPDASALNFGTGDFSIDAWIRTSADGNRPIVDKQSPGYSLRLNDGQVNFDVCDDSVCTNATTAAVVNDGAWHHIAATLFRAGGTQLDIYLDGALAASSPVGSLGTISGSSDLLIGAAPSDAAPTQFFDGEIDEIEIFSRALNTSEILAIAQANIAGKCKWLPPTNDIYAGLPHLPLGQAKVGVDSDDDLRIWNLGSTPDDGVAIDLGESDGLDLELIPGALPEGSVVTLSKIGRLAGMPDQLLATLTTTIVGGDHVLEPDFAPLGASMYTAQAFLGDVMVQEVSGLTGAAVSHAAASALFGNLFKRKKAHPP